MTDIRIGLGLADWRWIGRLAVYWQRIGERLADRQWIEDVLAKDWRRVGDASAMDWQID